MLKVISHLGKDATLRVQRDALLGLLKVGDRLALQAGGTDTRTPDRLCSRGARLTDARREQRCIRNDMREVYLNIHHRIHWLFPERSIN